MLSARSPLSSAAVGREESIELRELCKSVNKLKERLQDGHVKNKAIGVDLDKPLPLLPQGDGGKALPEFPRGLEHATGSQERSKTSPFRDPWEDKPLPALPVEAISLPDTLELPGCKVENLSELPVPDVEDLPKLSDSHVEILSKPPGSDMETLPELSSSDVEDVQGLPVPELPGSDDDELPELPELPDSEKEDGGLSSAQTSEKGDEDTERLVDDEKGAEESDDENAPEHTLAGGNEDGRGSKEGGLSYVHLTRLHTEDGEDTEA